MNVLSHILNSSLKSGFTNDEKSDLRKLNGIVISFAFLGFISSFFPFITKNYFLSIPLFCLFVLYCTTFIFTSRGKIRFAKYYFLLLVEISTFLISFFLLLPKTEILKFCFAPSFVFFILYPILAASFNLKILPHAIVGILQALIFQLIYIFNLNIPIAPMHEEQVTLSILLSTFYVFILTSVLVYMINHENNRLKKIEKNYSEDLKSTMNELNATLYELKQQKGTLELQSKELNELNTTKNRLFSIIAHDLRSPLNAILGFTELMLHKNFSEEKKRFFLGELNNTARTTFELLDNLLQWARSQSERLGFHPQNLVLKQIVEECIEAYQTLITAKEIKITNAIEPTQLIYADKHMLSTVVRNLINNAIKYSYSGGEIYISGKNVPDHSFISVKDFGVGMNETSKNQLFNFLTNSIQPGTMHEMGTGLGLQLCKEFTEKHHGSLEVISDEEKGAEFIAYFPNK